MQVSSWVVHSASLLQIIGLNDALTTATALGPSGHGGEGQTALLDLARAPPAGDRRPGADASAIGRGARRGRARDGVEHGGGGGLARSRASSEPTARRWPYQRAGRGPSAGSRSNPLGAAPRRSQGRTVGFARDLAGPPQPVAMGSRPIHRRTFGRCPAGSRPIRLPHESQGRDDVTSRHGDA